MKLKRGDKLCCSICFEVTDVTRSDTLPTGWIITVAAKCDGGKVTVYCPACDATHRIEGAN
jgi:hypothetical protein